jgi:hypothetical protein
VVGCAVHDKVSVEAVVVAVALKHCDPVIRHGADVLSQAIEDELTRAVAGSVGLGHNLMVKINGDSPRLVIGFPHRASCQHGLVHRFQVPPLAL